MHCTSVTRLPRMAGGTKWLLGDRPPQALDLGLLVAPWADPRGPWQHSQGASMGNGGRAFFTSEKSWAPGSQPTEVI